MTDEIQSPGSLLANEMYAEPKPAIEPAVEAVVEPVVEPVIEADPDVKPDIEAEVEIEGEGEGVDIKTFEELAEHLETDTDFLRGLSVTEKVNGKPVEVSITEALSTHRKVKAADSYLTDAKEKAKTIVSEATQQKDQFSQSVATFATLIQAVEQDIEADIKTVDWAGLRKDDPAEYAAKKLEVDERREKLNGMKQQAAEGYKQLVAQSDAAMKKQRLESLPHEQEALLSRIPEWSDEDKASKERDEVVNYLSADGFTKEEIEIASFNGKLLAYVVKAMRYDNSKDKSQAAKKKVTKIPKILKPGAKSNAAQPSAKDDDRQTILYG